MGVFESIAACPALSPGFDSGVVCTAGAGSSQQQETEQSLQPLETHILVPLDILLISGQDLNTELPLLQACM